MKVIVTQDHIKNGMRYSSTLCPIALSLREHGVAPTVGAANAGLYGKNGFFYRGRLPDAAQLFVARFDEGDKVEPFEFDLELERRS